jgi:colanic acid biosynthesis glycosyl transferase WcaI
MRILFISDNFPPEFNAPASRTYEHARYWVKWGHDVTILTCAPNFPDGKVFDGYKNKWKQTEIIDGIKVVRVKTYITANEGFLTRVFDYVSFMMSSIIFGIFQKKPDLIIATSPQFFAAVGGWALSTIRRVPFIFELRDLWPASILAVDAMQKSFLIPAMERVELFLYQKAKLVIALTETFKTNLIDRGIPKNKIHVITNGVDSRIFSPQPKNSELIEQLQLSGKFILGYIGTLGMAQELESVIEAADKLKNNSDIHFLFVGSGAEKKSLMDMADEKKLSNVTFLPPQPRADIPKYWSICDVALIHLKDHPIFETVIPSKIFEAMAMGIPILLSSPEGEASSIINNTDCGCWTKAGDTPQFCKAIKNIRINPGLLNNYSESGVKASPSHSREKKAKEMITVIKNFFLSINHD